MMFQMIVCLCCLVGCSLMLLVNLIVYWKISKALKEAIDKMNDKGESELL